jgi:hypothetical protein
LFVERLAASIINAIQRRKKKKCDKIYDVYASNMKGAKTVYVDSNNDDNDENTTVIKDDADAKMVMQ